MTEKSRHRLVIAAIIISTSPFLLLVPSPSLWGLTKSTALWGSSVAGYIGLSLLLWQFILGTRAISGLFFKDLAAKLKLHSWLGTYGIVIFLLHPLLILVAYAEPWQYVLVPSFKNGYESSVTWGRFALLAILLIWLTSAIMRGAISYRPWKYLHYLAYPVLFLSLLHVPDIGTSFKADAIQAYWICYVAITLLCVALRLRHVFGFDKLAYSISFNKRLSDSVHLLRLTPQKRALGLRAGQYVYLQMGLKTEEHPFTVLDYSSDGDILVAFKIYGRFTQKLALKLPGDTLLVDGPYGSFLQEPSMPPESVFIAGGIGVTPFFKRALEQPGHYLLYANRTRQSAVLRTVFKKALGNRYTDILSRQDGPLQAGEVSGRISSQIIEQLIPNAPSKHYFVCGPESFTQHVFQELLRLDVPPNQISLEAFSF